MFVQRTSDSPAAREQDAEAGSGGLGQREDRAAAESAGGCQQKEERAGDGEQVSSLSNRPQLDWNVDRSPSPAVHSAVCSLVCSFVFRLINQRLMEEQSQVEELQRSLQEEGSKADDVSTERSGPCFTLLPVNVGNNHRKSKSHHSQQDCSTALPVKGRHILTLVVTNTHCVRDVCVF